jgi:diguanylate cyclase (GGDEF)-like protein
MGQATPFKRLDYDHLVIDEAEECRLALLNQTRLLDTAPEREYDRITRLVVNILNVPIAAVTLVDRNRQWFKSAIGIDDSETPRKHSFCSHAVALKDVLAIQDATLDRRFADNPYVTGDPNVRFYLGAPLRTSEGEVLGALCAVDSVSRTASRREIEILTDLADLVAEQIEFRRAATLDSLTGALQRMAFLAEAGRDIALARRSGRPLSCLMIDADHFKTINDTFGHAAGDTVLGHIVAECREVLREADYIGRLGGEEFGVMLPDADLEHACAIAERVRRRVAGRPIQVGGDMIAATISVGVTVLGPSDTLVSGLLDRADHALYEAKLGGRNQFCRALS